MKNLSPALLAHYRSGSTTLARLWQIDRQDGLSFRFTDLDVEVIYQGQRYEPSSVFDSSALKSRSDMSVDNLSAIGLLNSDGITAQDMEAGLWDGAAFRIVEVNYRDLSMGENVLRVGRFGEVQRQQGQYTVEMRGLTHYLQNAIGRIITSSCDANLGDERCKVNLELYRNSSEVTAVVSNRQFTAVGVVDNPNGPGYYDGGEVLWFAGANAGLRMEIKRQLPGQQLELQLKMPYPVVVGDTFTMVPGCNKIHTIDAEGIPRGDCRNKYDNVLNFRGFDAVPGQDKVLLVGGQ